MSSQNFLKLNLLKLTSVIAFLGASDQSLADVEMSTLSSFQDLPALVNTLKSSGWVLGQTLIVMDGDDTLSRMPCPVDSKTIQQTPQNCQYLGGPAWFTWQNNLLPATGKPPSEACKEYCVATDFTELLNVSAYLFAASKMQYAETGQAQPLESFAAQGVRLMALTARGDSNISATEMQFTNLPLPLSPGLSLFDLLQKNAPSFQATPFPGEVSSLASPFSECAGGSDPRPESYRNGIFYASGQNKGTALTCFLKAYKTTPQGQQGPIENIIFIDDSEDNVVDVYTAFKTLGTYNVRSYHYTYLQAHKALFVSPIDGKPYRDMSKKRWEDLRKALEGAILEPAISNN